ncbi:AAA family ATPase [Fulvivirga sp. 29W222]|uniref:AAA family ATPase n=1 Tax=Fulvivirga marina TaxID=2494733 RepID=A0A937G0K0_9BACT|nr:AAA family ATPase [Fulvivirga marina]MBL6448417.1 AAA family ATPase [Fulvivirga marina]
MIRIKKGEIPDMLRGTFIKKKEILFEYLRDTSRVKRPSFVVRGKETPLYQEFNSKCAFCESKTKSVDGLNYHHYRPTYNATDRHGEISKNHYTWLMYEWDNLYLVCNTCARNKANYFPVIKLNGRFGLIEGKPESNEFDREVLNEKEYPLIFDPCHYDPEEWFYYSDNGTIHLLVQNNEFGAERSSYTIQCLDLNREQLIESRKKRIEWIKNVIDQVKKNNEISEFQSEDEASIINEVLNESHEEYCGALRFIVKRKIASDGTFMNWLVEKKIITKQQGKEIKDFFEKNSFIKIQGQKEDKVILRSESLGQIRVNEIRIKGFRAIKDEVTLQFPNTSSTRENWLVLIGENGSGKSTILQAVYACLSGDWYNVSEDDFEDYGIIHIGTDDGYITLRKNEISDTLTSVKKGSNTPILGYGPIRLSLSDYSDSELNPELLEGSNLVNPLRPLLNTGQWIKDRILKGDFDKNTIKESLLKLVDRDNTYDIHLVDGKAHIVSNLDESQKHDYQYLSTGFRQLLTLACDIIDSLNLKYNDIQSARGIVLLDEIENHLHPKWKNRIVGQLREIFPMVQFIVATHEPLCINSLEEGEVFLTKRNEDGKVEIQGLEVPKGTKSSEILTGEWFGLTSTLDTKTLDLMERHREMMYSKALKSEDYNQEELTRIESEIASRLSNSADRTLFGIFKEEYKAILTDSVQSLDFNSKSFRDTLKAKLKSKLDN